MCGIFGGVAPKSSSLSIAIIDRLASANTDRGNRNHGYYAVRNEDEVLVKRTAPMRFDDWAGLRNCFVLAAHVRAPTENDAGNVFEVHPIEMDNFIAAHNGLLQDYDQYPPITSDSVFLFRALSSVGGDIIAPKHIAQVAGSFIGQQACWLINKYAKESIYLWRVMSPIYTGEDDFGCQYFSSVEVEPCVDMLMQGTVYKLTTVGSNVDVSIETSFAYKNPFETVL